MLDMNTGRFLQNSPSAKEKTYERKRTFVEEEHADLKAFSSRWARTAEWAYPRTALLRSFSVE